ncbi:MAG: GIY-YIG nuclease family protein [Patescibacteria group bacterium]
MKKNIKKKIQNKPNLQKMAAKLPFNPGVYFFIDKNNEILYIGRATSLKKRVASYFRPNLDPRIAEMVSLAKKIKHRQTDTLLDAIILEANEIKKHWPKYNVKDKDNRSFVYVAIPQKDFAYPIIIRERELAKFPSGKNQIFGPYQNATLLKNALRLIRRIFPYCLSRPNSGQACFDYQIGLCPGSCLGLISKADYQKNIKNIILLLRGQKKRLLTKLKKDNPEAVKALRQLQDVILIANDELSGSIRPLNRIEGYDISHLSGKETVGAMAVFSDGQPDKTQYRLFNIKSPANDDLRALEEMISRRLNHAEWPRPDIILLDGGKPQIDFIYKLFKDKNINIPLIGLSKFGGDKLVFAPKTSQAIKELSEGLKKTLLQTRDEAHRFGNMARKRKMKIKNI